MGDSFVKVFEEKAVYYSLDAVERIASATKDVCVILYMSGNPKEENHVLGIREENEPKVRYSIDRIHNTKKSTFQD